MDEAHPLITLLVWLATVLLVIVTIALLFVVGMQDDRSLDDDDWFL